MDIDALFELDSLRGRPDGPVQFIEALGMEVPTYVDARKDLLPAAVHETLMYHVPLKFRGPYKAHAHAEQGPHGETLGPGNYCMCMRVSQGRKMVGDSYVRDKTPRPCGNKAINYSGKCGTHGGALHPLDKSEPTLTREAAFKAGKLDVRDMDDEELARGQVRKADGTWTNYRSIPREIFQAAQAELFQRADIKLRENLITAVDTMAEIASGTAYEPEVRIRAAQFIYERVRGKNPDIVVHTQDKPFEIMMSDMVLGGGSRAQSRAQRGLENAIDAEVIEDPYGDNEAQEYRDAEAEGEEYEDEIELVPLQPELPTYPGTAGRPTNVPPVDPILRDKWERDKLANENQVQETVAELKARLDKARADARGKRYAARNKGLDHVESYGYGWESTEEWVPDPNDPEYEIPQYRTKFTEPVIAKVPASVKAADTRRIKRTR